MLKAFIILIAALLLMGESSEAHLSCRSLFRVPLKGYFKVDRNHQQKINFVLNDRDYRKYQDKVVGTIEYDYFFDSNKLMIEWVHVDKNLENLGISNQLIQEVLETNPDTAQITGYLTDSNYRSYQQNLKKGLDPLEALHATPFFKSFAGFGFSDLVSYADHDGRVVVLLRRR
jgi:hypothetical protein